MPKPSSPLVGMPSWTGRVVRETEHGIRPRVPRQLAQVMACGLCGGLYLSKERAGCRGGTYAWYPRCSATSYLGVGIGLYRANRQARRQDGRRDARLAAPMDRDGRPHDANEVGAGGLWGLSVPCILCCGHEWPAGKTVWTLLRNGRRSGRMGASGLPWDTASDGGGDGSLFFVDCVCKLCGLVRGGRRCLVAGRAGLSASRRPSSSALCMPLDRSCWSASRRHTQALQRAHSTPRLVTARRLHDYRFALQKKQWLFPPPHSLQRELPPHTEGTAESEGRRRKASKPDHSADPAWLVGTLALSCARQSSLLVESRIDRAGSDR